MTVLSPTPPRLVSLDQFRGYTVAGMIFVNWLAEYKGWVPPVLHHHHTFCSYADTIMPHFLFAVGFAMRLSFGRRVLADGLAGGYWRMVRRILGLFLVSFAIYTEGRVAANWEQLRDRGAWDILIPFLKREWMQTLGQIAVTSLWILPVIRARASVRVMFMIASGLLHVVLSHLFNFHWTNSAPAGIDGGPLGFMTWAVPAILGTLTCDAIMDSRERPPLFKLTLLAIVIMALGYVMSCGTRLYDLSPSELAALKQSRISQDADKKKIADQIAPLSKQIADFAAERDKLAAAVAEARRVEVRKYWEQLAAKPENAGRSRRSLIEQASREAPHGEAWNAAEKKRAEFVARQPEIDDLKSKVRELQRQERSFLNVKLAASPVIPPRDAWKGRDWKSLLAEPPFVPPPADDPRIDAPPYDMHRYWNYWMMTQRGGALSYLTFAGGFSILVYVVFYILGDVIGIRIGLFRTLGTNALAAYVLHSLIGNAVKSFIPGDAPYWYPIVGFCVSLSLIWLFVRTFERNGIYLRV